jgi:hypothetical protein
MVDSSNIASTISTGGGGVVFEQHVGAAFLALLLTKAFLPVHSSSIPTRIHFQAKRIDWNVDDLVVEGTDSNGVQHKLAAQVKRTFTVSETDEDCVKTFVAAWTDFNNAALFNKSHDALVLVTYLGTNRLLGDFGALLTQARASSTAVEFDTRRASQGLLNKRSKADYETIRKILETSSGAAIAAAEFLDFLRVFHVLSYDFSNPSAKDESWIKSLLYLLRTDNSPQDSASSTWNELVVLASKAGPDGKSYARDELPVDMRQRHREVQASQQGALGTLQGHSGVVLQRVSSEGPKGLTFARSELRDELNEASIEAQIVLIVGVAGSGKSMLAKKHVLGRLDSETVFAFAAEEFKVAHIDQVLLQAQVDLNWPTLRALFPIHTKTFLIDGLERLLESDERNAFTDLMKATVDDPSIRLVITCRDYHAETVERSILRPSGASFRRVLVPELNDSELGEAQDALPQLAPLMKSPPLKALLRNPFILARVADLTWPESQPLPQTERALRELLWNEVVRQEAKIRDNMPNRRADALTKISLARAESLQPYVQFNADETAVQALAVDNLIAFDAAKRSAPAHDVFEDWALIEWLTGKFAMSEDDPKAFSQSIGTFPAVRRAYRKWLHEMLESEPENTAIYLSAVIGDVAIPGIFKDDTLIAVFQSSAAEKFLADFGVKLLENDAQLITRVIHLVRVACKTVSPLQPSGVSEFGQLHIPAGKAWPTLLVFLVCHWNAIPATHHRLLIGFIEDWASGISWMTPYPDGFKSAGELIEKLLPMTHASYREKSGKQRILDLLLKFPKGAETLFKQLIGRAKVKRNRRNRHEDDPEADLFAKAIFKPFACYAACRDFPDEVIELCIAKWVAIDDEDEDKNEYFSRRDDIESGFGLSDSYDHRMFPPSALQGPFLFILREHPAKGVKFITRLVNNAATFYANDRGRMQFVERPWTTQLVLASGASKDIFCNDRLWNAFRGMSVIPDIVQCALMALEKWLFESIEIDWCEKFVRDALGWLLGETNNAALASVVASVCTAYPNKSGDAALSILGCRDFFGLDIRRSSGDPQSLAIGGFSTIDQMFQKERLESKKLPHRSEHLESLALKLQMTDKRQAVFDILDMHRAKLPEVSKQNNDDRWWRLSLDRMDLRRYDINRVQGNGFIELRMQVPDDDVQKLIDDGAQGQEHFLSQITLMNWTRNQFDKNQKCLEEAKEWPTMLALAKAVRNEFPNGLDGTGFLNAGPNVAAAIGIRDHWDSIDAEDRVWCRSVIFELILRPLADDNASELHAKSPMSGIAQCATTLALMAARSPEDSAAIDTLVAGLSHFNEDVRLGSIDGVSSELVGKNEPLFRFCLWVIFDYSKQWNVIDERNKKLRFDQRPSITKELATTLAATRKESNSAWFTTIPDMNNLMFDSWPDRRLVRMFLRLYGSHPNQPLAQVFFAKVATAITSWWSLRRSGTDKRESAHDFELENMAVREFAKFVLTSEPKKALELVAPLVGAVEDCPKGVESFLNWLLLIELDEQGSSTYWQVWATFADAIRNATWQKALDSEYSDGRSTVGRSFLNISWNSGIRKWARLGNRFVDVDAHFVNSPQSTYTLGCYIQYLYQIGEASLPNGFTLIAEKFGDRLGEAVTADGNIKFYLDALVSRVLFENLSEIRRTQRLRQSMMAILDALVQSGSSIAFQLRDDFVTPTANVAERRA